jgi:all-trans-retinol dehydrogenase (NAD+)
MVNQNTMTRRNLNGSRVLVTGGGSGIGRQMGVQAAERGAHVIIWDRDGKAGDRVRDEIRKAGGSAESHTVDITDVAGVNAAAKASGAVDVVINNAGIVAGKHLLDSTEDSIRRTYEVNALGLYWVTRAVLPGMIERGDGSVVTIASAAGLLGVAQQTDYSATKFAAVGFMESLRAEMRALGHPIDVLTVCPFFIDTGMFEGAQTKFPLLLPVLKEGPVANEVLNAIERRKPTLLLPPFARVLPLARLLPVRIFDRLADFLGVNQTMDHFVGRAGTKG